MLRQRYLKALTFVVLSLLIVQFAMVLLSWIIVSVMPASNVQSLLSAEGIRWLLGSFAANLQTPFLIWLLLSGIAYGALSRSGIATVLVGLLNGKALSFRERLALLVSIVMLGLFILTFVLLTMPSQAILLSVSGDLFPSSFSRSVIPASLFLLASIGSVFGYIARRYSTPVDCVASMIDGVSATSPIVLLYVIAYEMYLSIGFVFRCWQY